MDVIDRGARLLFDEPTDRDYNHATDDTYSNLRNKASKLYDQRNELSKKSQQAYKSGDGQKAHELSVESKEILAKAERYNQQAAEYVFRENNTDSAEYEVDLHGLYIKEAEFFLQARIIQYIKTNQSRLDVIVGKGNHSKNGIAKLKPAIDEMCDEAKLKHRINPDNSGVLNIDLSNAKMSQIPKAWVANVEDGMYDHVDGPEYKPSHNQSQQQSHHQQSSGGNDIKTGNTIIDLLIKGFCMCLNSK